jgi:uncharacterized cupredoxin-like copper-binding protein
MIAKRLLFLLGVSLLAFALLLAGCGGDDDKDETGGSTGTADSATGSGDTGDSGDEEEAGPGVVTEKPADATEIDVTLQEFAVAPSQSSVAAGKVYFKVENKGPEDAHEFVIVRTDLGPLDLPFEDNKVPEDQVDIVDEIEPFTPDSTASITVDLEAGKYLLICNITQTEDDGTIESHYKKGMVAAFTVE